MRWPSVIQESLQAINNNHVSKQIIRSPTTDAIAAIANWKTPTSRCRMTQLHNILDVPLRTSSTNLTRSR